MQGMKRFCDTLRWAQPFRFSGVLIFLVGCSLTSAVAQQHGQKTFSSAEEASSALVTAAQNNDEKAMLDILGPDAKQVVSSGDDTEDAENRANFVQKYQEMHRLVKEPDGTTTLYVGAENWPVPMPLVKANAWYFDTDAAKKEILFRRIGQNEMSAVNVCQQLVLAEKEFYSTQHGEYAQKFFSDDGQHNGLYWKAANGESQSPIGPLVASAVVEGYTKSDNGSPTPYHGYYYRVLTEGKDLHSTSPKGYIVDGKMTKGFAFVAFPAEYRASGVMTFIVSSDGVVYQRDLGSNTAALAKAMKAYNPTGTWKQVEDEQPETANGQQAH
jgi:hypothetical protein